MVEEPGHALDLGIAGLRAGYEAGLDPVSVVDEVLDRIGRSGDRAIWIDLESAASLAAAAGTLRRGDRATQPLWGIPFGVKDNIDVAGRTTTSGLPSAAYVATRTAPVVERLLAAGAIYVGKTNLDQLATGLVGTRSPYGTPRNPFDPDLIPGGSSSGSAVAVARHQVALALGTDTAGSGRVPAAMCGVVGMKAAPGRRPLVGVTPASPTIDCVSSFALTVADGLLVESVIGAGPWAVATGPFRVAGADDASSARLRAGGHTVVAATLAPFHEAGDLLYGGAWLADRTAALGPMLAGDTSGLVETVAQVVAGGARYSGAEVFAAQRRLAEIAADLETFWATVDVLVVPTVVLLPTLAEVADDPIGVNVRLGRNTTFANLLGLAAITVPAEHGPGGVTVLGPPHHAGAVAAVAAELHDETLLGGSEASGGRHLVAVVGAHLSGQPLNHQLVSAGGALVSRTRTSSRYRLYRLEGGPPARPGLDRVGMGGRPIEVEVWSLDDAGLGRLTGILPPPLGIGSVELQDGRWVKGMICEAHGLASAVDITHHGGWRAYLQS